jgi:hypothetical protein
MKRVCTLLLCGISIPLCHGQAARLVLNNASASVHPWIVFNPANNTGTYLVIQNPAPTGITQLITQNVPVIKSEQEENKVRWAVGTSTGSYVVPYSTASGVAMPLTVDVTGAGTGAGSLVFSTYNSLSIGTAVASGWNNDTYKPSDVTHMLDMPSGSVNNSNNAIDRFWIIDAGEGSYAYTTKPSVDITFGFDPVETAVNGGNSAGLDASNNNLVAQRFNSTLTFWYDVAVMGSQSGNTVGGVSPAPADLFRSWTLSNKLMPLPIQLVAWKGSCADGVVKLEWTTASEKDNAWFTVEKSSDLQHWWAIGTMPGAGNSDHPIHYVFTDAEGGDMAYYRLRQTDINGTDEVSGMIAVGCGESAGTEIVNAWQQDHQLDLEVVSGIDGLYDLDLVDVNGQRLRRLSGQVIRPGRTLLHVDVQDLAVGIYVVRLSNGVRAMARRVHLQ